VTRIEACLVAAAVVAIGVGILVAAWDVTGVATG
jgi:hypothetical protein